MRIVFDTNVLIAAVISRGLCHELFESCIVSHAIVGSAFITDELREKLISKFKYSDGLANEAAELLCSRMEMVNISPLPSAVSRDPDDDNILAAALAGNCSVIVTGDKDLLDLMEFEGITIVRPREFIERFGSRP